MAKRLSVLLVEDSEDDALLLERELRLGGYQPNIHRVDTEIQLAQALEDDYWEVVITDHNLPGFSSVAVMHMLQAAELDIPIIIVSGSIGEEVAVQAMKTGASDYIMKNNMARLAPAIERELRDAEVRRQKREAERTIRYMAFYDPLTQLPNRRLLMDRLEHALHVSNRNQHFGALMYLDLDNFKNLNDTKGHQYGDMLLNQVAKRLVACLREHDTVARLGGDEFVVMLESLDINVELAVLQAKAVGNKIVSALNAPAGLNGHEYYCSCSIGIALFHGAFSRLDELLIQADTAMYEAKKAGRNTLRFFDPLMQENLEQQVQMENDLRQAIAKQQFQLYYQLQLDQENQVLGVEALLRWLHPEKGLISPSDFIPLAEEIHLIEAIGLWVLENACFDIKAWEQCPYRQHLTIAVNVSSLQFVQQDFVKSVEEIINSTGIAASKLKLELTESMVLSNVDDAISKMLELKALGLALALDDFGTGYSSLSYLRRLPFDQIKIDRSFINSASTDSNDAFLVNVIIGMGRQFHMQVIAEGVETTQQFTLLKNLQCSGFQGYLFGKPMLSSELLEVIKTSYHLQFDSIAVCS